MADDSEPKAWWKQRKRWRDFGAAVVLVGLFPLLPLVLELGITREIASDSLMITAALDGLAVALTSRSTLLFGLFLAFTVAAAGFYGAAVPGGSHTGHAVGSVAGLRLSATSQTNVTLGSVFFWALIPPFVVVVGQRFLLHMRLGQRLLQLE